MTTLSSNMRQPSRRQFMCARVFDREDAETGWRASGRVGGPTCAIRTADRQKAIS